ncbi:hypothetical protein ACIO87_26660 [Streptomyces sp. NPDC087218]|uniref:hypothetical protein n=1 Tax=Streptomyces sp. NPDC087218 TaxID=3365769 RepID=UPI0038098A5B
MPTRIVDTYEAHVTSDEDGADVEVERIDEPGLGVKKCRGLGTRAGFPGKWTAGGDLQDSRLLSVCGATVLDREDPTATDPEPPDGAVVEVSAAFGPSSPCRSVTAGRDSSARSRPAPERRAPSRPARPRR